MVVATERTRPVVTSHWQQYGRYLFTSLLLALGLVPLVATVHAATRDEAICARLAQRRPEQKVVFDSASQRCTINDLVLSFDNIKREVAQRGLVGQQADALIDDWVGRMLAAGAQGAASDAAWDSVRDHVYPMIAPASYARMAACRPLTPRVATCFVVDSPTGVSYLLRRDLEAWQITEDQVRQQAVANLTASPGNDSITVNRDGGRARLLVSAAHDAYDAARLTLPLLQQRLSREFPDGAFVAIPNRDFLVAWPVGLPVHLAMWNQVPNDYSSRPHPLTDELFVVVNGVLRPATRDEQITGRLESAADESAAPRTSPLP